MPMEILYLTRSTSEYVATDDFEVRGGRAQAS